MGRRETPNLAYPPAFKLEIAKFAQKYSQYAAAKIFSVARRRIFDWMRQIPKLQDLIGNDKFSAFHTGIIYQNVFTFSKRSHEKDDRTWA